MFGGTGSNTGSGGIGSGSGSGSGSGVDDLKALLQSTVGNLDFHGIGTSSSITSIGTGTGAGAPSSSILERSSYGGGLSTTGGMSNKQERKNEIPVLDELASLIGSVDFDLNPSKKTKSTLPISSSKPATSPASKDPFSSAADSILSMKDLLQNVKHYQDEELKEMVEDKEDYSVVRYGISCTLRGRQGRVMTSVASISNAVVPKTTSQPTTTSSGAGGVVYLLGIDGQGVGDDSDTLVFVNTESKDSRDAIRYGDIVSIRSPSSKDRYLGTRDSTKLGFWRPFVGQGEKWLIIKGTPKGLEEKSTRGQFVRTGALIMLQNSSSDMILSLHEGAEGRGGKLVHKDRTGTGGEVWQIDWIASQPYPQWVNQRPYLSGMYLMMSPQERYNPSSDTVARTFPRSTNKQDTSAEYSSELKQLNSYPPSVQEGILLREVILTLSGVEGMYVRVSATDHEGHKVSKLNQLHLAIDSDSADRGLGYQVELLLPICECANRVRAFIRTYSRYEYGSISHAIASTIKSMLKEFELIVAQLEHLLSQQKLSLQRMVFLLQPTKITLRCLDHFIFRLSSHIGGSMLDIIHAGLLEQGDEKSRLIYESILQSATKPFIRMLSQWLYEGILYDPYEEFFISELKSLLRHSLEDDFNAHYWEDRYQLRPSKIPKLLQSEVNKILITGKYLNVIRECCTEVKLETDDENAEMSISFTIDEDLIVTMKKYELSYDTNTTPTGLVNTTAANINTSGETIVTTSPSLMTAIEEAYQFSSSIFLQLLEKKYNLRSHLKSLKRFFLLENGDFFIQFMDLTEDELRKDVKEISLQRIQNLLLLSLHTSTLANDSNKDELSCIFASHNLIQHLHLIQTAGEGMSAIGYPPMASTTASSSSTHPHHPMESFSILGGQGLKGIEALTLEYKVGWPLSIVLSKRAITKYQLLSRLLFFCKYIELVLLECWKDNQNTKEMNLRRVMSSSYSLRHRMLHFIQNFVYYMTNEVITPRYHEMLEGMSKASNIDEVSKLHEYFLDLCLKECLLASQDLLRILTKITTTCLLFAEQMKRFTFSKFDEEVGNEVNSKLVKTNSASSSASVPSSAAESIRKKSQLRTMKLRIQADYIAREVSHDAYIRTLAKFSDTFDSQLGEFLEKLWTDSYRTHPQLSNLCIRLDYNGFYDTRFAGQQNIRAEYGTSLSSRF